MHFPISEVLENEKVILFPLEENDFDILYAVASDPLIWEQHPNKDRWKKEVFRTFFDGALQSKGAFKIVEKSTGKVAGCSRIYDYNKEEDKTSIGYTFFGRAYWGTGINPSVKGLMLDYVFQFVSKVQFHVGASNTRSQIAISRLGGTKVSEQQIAYFGEAPKPNYIFQLTRKDWQSRANQNR